MPAHQQAGFYVVLVALRRYGKIADVYHRVCAAYDLYVKEHEEEGGLSMTHDNNY